MKRSLRLVLVFSMGAVPLFAETPVPAPSPTPAASLAPASKPDFSAASDSKYGVYPIAYKEIIQSWMKNRLVDPQSAVYEFPMEPRQAEMQAKDGQNVRGYYIEYRVNARSKLGNVTGWQSRWVLIRNGEIVQGTGVES